MTATFVRSLAGSETRTERRTLAGALTAVMRARVG